MDVFGSQRPGKLSEIHFFDLIIAVKMDVVHTRARRSLQMTVMMKTKHRQERRFHPQLSVQSQLNLLGFTLTFFLSNARSLTRNTGLLTDLMPSTGFQLMNQLRHTKGL